MALTESEETKVRAIISAYDNGQQVDDLPLASSAMNKVIEVFDTAGGESQRMGLEDAVIGASQAYCGRVWNLDNATTVAASTIGSKDLLRQFADKIGLGCYLVQNDHTRQKLDAKDHYRLATGEACRLDGSQGHYQWGWGREWYAQIKTVNRQLYITLSLTPRKGEYNYRFPVASMSASGHAALDRTTMTLVSYINRDARYRGGNNTADWDDTYRSLLGMPATYQTTQNFLNYAKKNGDGWFSHLMRMNTAVAILFYVIFGNRNVQATFNPQKDADGLYQGGLGSGVSSISDWNGYNGYNPIIPMDAGMDLGDACGVSTYNVMDENGTVRYAAPVPVFFGLKNPYGHLWRMMCDEQFQANENTSLTHLVVKLLQGAAWSIGNATGFRAYTTTPTKCEGFTKELAITNLEMCPTLVGGSETTYWADYFWNTSGVTSGFRFVGRGGSADNGGRDGLAFVSGSDGVAYARAYYGAALCECAEEWPVEPEYCTM